MGANTVTLAVADLAIDAARAGAAASRQSVCVEEVSAGRGRNRFLAIAVAARAGRTT